MKTNVLTPLFELVAHIALRTDIDLQFQARRLSSGDMYISWYIGDCENPDAGDFSDWLMTDDLDENKLDRWVAELTGWVYQPEDEGAPWDDEESQEEIDARENHTIDSQEDRTL